jgi:hypothetical protein
MSSWPSWLRAAATGIPASSSTFRPALCGDPGWDYINGRDERHGMARRISCGYLWTRDDPGWRAQVLPDRVP